MSASLDVGVGVVTKRARLSEDAELHKGTAASINNLVFDLVISMSTDEELLRTCRLVCRSWNMAACARLRKTAIVTVAERFPADLEELTSLMRMNEINLPQLPSPFRKFQVCLETLENASLLSLVEREDVVVTGLNFELCDFPETKKKAHEKKLKKIFSMHKNSLEALELQITTIPNWIKPGSFPYKIILPNLKKLKIMSYHDYDTLETSPLPFEELEHLFRHSKKLEYIKLDITKPEYQAKILSFCSLENLQKLILKWEFIKKYEWKKFLNFSFPKLRSLTLLDGEPENIRIYESRAAKMVSKVAQTLELLRGNNFPLQKLPTFPKLRELVCWRWESKVGEISMERFPSLESITLDNDGINHYRIERHFNPHYGVKKITYRDTEREVSNMEYTDDEDEDAATARNFSFKERLYIALQNLGLQFPNVEEFQYIAEWYYVKLYPMFSSGSLFLVHKAFPHLKSFSLHASSNFRVLSGIMVNVEGWLKDGLHIANIPSGRSLLDFQELEKLELGPEIVVTSELVQYCLGRIPKLKHLKFRWSNKVTARAVWRGLGHLERIDISCKGEREAYLVQSKLPLLVHITEEEASEMLKYKKR